MRALSAQPDSAARGLLLAAVGALAGYLLWTAYHALALLRPELVRLIVTRRNMELLWAAIGNMEVSRYLLEAIPYLVLATPGALLLGIPGGIALRHITHKRLLVYSVLAWPLGTYAYSSFVLRVLKNLAEQDQVALWHSRGVGALHAFTIYSLFFVVVYLSHWVSARMRRHKP